MANKYQLRLYEVVILAMLKHNILQYNAIGELLVILTKLTKLCDCHSFLQTPTTSTQTDYIRTSIKIYMPERGREEGRGVVRS